MAAAEKIYIVGIGEDGLEGLSLRARKTLEQAERLLGEEYLLARVPPSRADRVVLGISLEETVHAVEASRGKRTVLLAVGDPLFYGVAHYLFDRLGKERFEVLPHVSTMQSAFSRVMESWEDAMLENLASRSLDSILEKVRSAEKVGLFTTEDVPPKRVARVLLDHKIDYFTVYVCENLETPSERVTSGALEEIATQDFAPLNVMILVRKPHVPDRPAETVGRRLFGNPDETFLQSKPKRGLLTPAEIRAVALAEMDIGPASVVWDIGAGSGSVAVEAAQIARDGTVYAIEMDPEDHQLILQNANRFQVKNLVGVLGRAPEAWQDLPEPDCVFVGGSGRGVLLLVEAAYQRLRGGGRLVATMGSIDNVADTHRLLHGLAHDVQVWMLHFARGSYQMDRLRFQSLNPTFLVSVVKPS